MPELTDTEGVSPTLLVGCTSAFAEEDRLVPERFRLRILDTEFFPFLDGVRLFRSTLIGDSALAKVSTGGSPKPAETCAVVTFT